MVLFEKATFLVISHATHTAHTDVHRFEKISNIIKQFKLRYGGSWGRGKQGGKELGREGWTVTPEYGPGYGGGGEMDVDKVNEEMARWFRTRFGTT